MNVKSIINLVALSFLTLFSFRAISESPPGQLTGTIFLKVCETDSTACFLMFGSAESGVTYGNKLIEAWRTNGDRTQMQDYFCWDKSVKLTPAEHLAKFKIFLLNLETEKQGHPIGLLVALYLRNTYPPC